MFRKVAYLGLILFFLLAANNLVHSIYDLWHKQQIINQNKQQLESERAENQKLKRELSYAQSNEFVEQEAYNKLFMVKPGEQQVVIAQSVLAARSKTVSKTKQNQSNWQQWLQTFHLL